MHLGYNDVMMMPYPTLVHVLNWKSDLEKEKKKKMDESTRRSKKSSKTSVVKV